MEFIVTIKNKTGTEVIAMGTVLNGFSLAAGGSINIAYTIADLEQNAEYQVSYLGSTRAMRCTALSGDIATFINPLQPNFKFKSFGAVDLS